MMSINNDDSVIGLNSQKIINNENACSASELQEDLSPSHETNLIYEEELIKAIEVFYQFFNFRNFSPCPI